MFSKCFRWLDDALPLDEETGMPESPDSRGSSSVYACLAKITVKIHRELFAFCTIS